jgi:hypothetical protein
MIHLMNWKLQSLKIIKNTLKVLIEIPESISITALDDWMSKNIPELPPVIEESINEETDSLKKDVIVVGDFPLRSE